MYLRKSFLQKDSTAGIDSKTSVLMQESVAVATSWETASSTFPFLYVDIYVVDKLDKCTKHSPHKYRGPETLHFVAFIWNVFKMAYDIDWWRCFVLFK